VAKSSKKIIKKISSDIYVYPTDTVWGVGANIFSKEGVAKVRAIKKSDSLKPMSVLFDCVENFCSYFSLPSIFDQQFLTSFFSLESTVLLPVSWLVKEIPEWVICNSDFVGCRCLDSSVIKTVISTAGGVVTTSSLNLSGGEPIVSYDEAKDFVKTNIEFAKIIIDSSSSSSVFSDRLSGVASTLVKYDGVNFSIIREGRLANELRNRVGLLSA